MAHDIHSTVPWDWSCDQVFKGIAAVGRLSLSPTPCLPPTHSIGNAGADIMITVRPAPSVGRRCTRRRSERVLLLTRSTLMEWKGTQQGRKNRGPLTNDSPLSRLSDIAQLQGKLPASPGATGAVSVARALPVTCIRGAFGLAVLHSITRISDSSHFLKRKVWRKRKRTLG